MADLDDFFAKKDRKKSKSVKKFATTDELAKKLEDTKQKLDVRPKKERPAQEGDETGRGTEEEEWKEFEEPIKDYTGLKIQVLQSGNGAQGATASDGSASEDASIEGSKPKGPWNKPTESAPVAPAVPAPAPVAEARAPSKPSTYVAPAPRVRAVEPPRRNQTKFAPDINNDHNFPVLGASGKRGGAGSGAGAGAAGGAPAGWGQPLALGNRFTALPDDS